MSDFTERTVQLHGLEHRFRVRAGSTDDVVVDEVWAENVYDVTPAGLEGRRVLDVGANIGSFAACAAKAGASVVAVEPQPANAALLRWNTAGLDVEVIEAACDRFPGDPASVQIAGEGGGAHTTQGAGGHRVPVVAPADLLAEHGPFDFVKVDTEGAEWRIWPEWVAVGMPFARMTAEFHGEMIAGVESHLPPMVERAAVVWAMTEFGSVHVVGQPLTGGMLRFWRYDD